MSNQTNKVTELPNGLDLNALSELLRYSDRYEINIQFWPDQLAVYIYKDGVELVGYGGSSAVINHALEYLNRINFKSQQQKGETNE